MTFKIADVPEQIEPGTYKAQLEGSQVMEEGSFKTDKNQKGSYRRWNWLVEVPGKEGLTPMSDNTSLFTGPKSITHARLTALLGRAPQAGEEIENPVGKTVLLTISKKDNGYAKIDLVSPYVDPQQTVPGVPR